MVATVKIAAILGLMLWAHYDPGPPIALILNGIFWGILKQNGAS